jgi:hypothetical protein
MRLRAFLAAAIPFVMSAAVQGQTAVPTLYIEPGGDGFETELTAAMTKKKVPVQVVRSADVAAYRLTVTIVQEGAVSGGLTVVPHPEACCGSGGNPGSAPMEFVVDAGNEGRVRVTAQLVDAAGVVVWSYAVSKESGAKSRRSLAETIATRLKDDYPKKRRTG